MSRIPGPDGKDLLFIHQIGQRSEVYSLAAFRRRLDRFHSSVWCEDSKRLKLTPEEAKYVNVDNWCDDTPSSDEAIVEPVLSDEQLGLLQQMLPFPGNWGPSNALVVLGKGAPGSGKTILAIDAARTAAEGDSDEDSPYSVLIVVPSKRLLALYRRELEKAQIGWDGLSGLVSQSPSRVTLVEAHDLFGGMSQTTVLGHEREAQLRQWWAELLTHNSLKPWVKRNPVVSSYRFQRLIDATLEDPSGLGANDKDALDSNDGPLYELVTEFRSHKSWMERARQTRRRRGFYLRSEIAEKASSVLCRPQLQGGADPWAGRLLVLVDEVQDLVPAEWGTLVQWCAARRRRGAITRIGFLGDENQRISPTSFSWNEVKQRCEKEFDADCPPPGEATLPVSYRLSKRVAGIAKELFHRSVSDKRKTREVRVVDPEQLPEQGVVQVAVVSDAARHVGTILRRLKELEAEEGQLQLIMHERAAATIRVLDDSRVDILTPGLAKGLEFSHLGVVEPFEGAGAKLSFDKAAVAYTALTRAVENLLVIMTPEEWRLVASRWREHVEPVLIPTDSAGLRELERLLLSIVGRVDIDVQAAALENRLRAQIESIPASGGSKHEANGIVSRIVAITRKLVALHRIQVLGDEFGGVLLSHKWLVTVARTHASEALASDDWTRMLALQILLGEYAAAASTMALASKEDQAALVPELDRMIRLDGDCQVAVNAIRTRVDMMPDVGGCDVLGFALVSEIAWQADKLPVPHLETLPND